jgi:hypothetical protein
VHGCRHGLTAALAAAGLALALAPSAAPAAARREPIETRLDLRPGLQLAAMRTAITAAPRYFEAFDPHCGSTTPMLTYVDGSVMAGNFRDQDGNCYVWLNLQQSPLLTAREICKLALHELGHLTGLQHSSNPEDVMYSPFVSNPIPGPCVKPLPLAKTTKHARRKRRRTRG